jgi:DNA-directed RNA polymerase specialized sigma subunit
MEVKKIENTKDYLRLVYTLNSMVDDVVADIERLKGIATRITTSTENERVQTSGCKDIVGDTAAKIYDRMQEANELEDMYIDIRNKIQWQIRGIALENADYYNILRLKYIEDKTFEEISDIIHLSTRRILTLHGQALECFEKNYGKEYLGMKFSIRIQKCS